MTPEKMAFPIVTASISSLCSQLGLSKREYFAAAVLPSLSWGEGADPDRLAQFAVKVADALISELERIR